MRDVKIPKPEVELRCRGAIANTTYIRTAVYSDRFIGVASYGPLGHVPLSTSSNNFFSSVRIRTKFIAVNSIWFSIPYGFENVWNWKREAFYDAIESTKIIFTQDPVGCLRRVDATFNPLSGRGGGMPLPFFTQSTASQFRRLVRTPRTKSLATPLDRLQVNYR